MEQQLDHVEEGKENWVGVIDRFYKPFAIEVEKAEEGIEKFKSKMSQQDLIVNYVAIRW